MSRRKPPLPDWVYDATRRRNSFGDGRAPLPLGGWERIVDRRLRRDKGLG